MSITISPPLHLQRRAEALAAREGISVEELTLEALNERVAVATASQLEGAAAATWHLRVGGLVAAARAESERVGDPALDTDGVNREVAARRGGVQDDP